MTETRRLLLMMRVVMWTKIGMDCYDGVGVGGDDGTMNHSTVVETGMMRVAAMRTVRMMHPWLRVLV